MPRSDRRGARVAPWLLGLAFPAGAGAALAAGAGPGGVAAGLAFAAFVLLALGAGGAAVLLIVACPFGPRVPAGSGTIHLATLLVVAALAAWLLTILARRGAFRALPRRLGLPLAAYLALHLVSAAAHAGDLRAHPAAALRLAQFAAYLALLPLGYDLAPRARRGVVSLLLVAALAGAIQALYGVFLADPGPGGFVVGTFDYEHNNFAAGMVMGLFLAIGLVVVRRDAAWGVTLLAAGGMSGVALLLSQSRTGLAGALAGVLALAALPMAARRRIALVAALVAAAVLAAFLAPDPLRDRVTGVLPGGGSGHAASVHEGAGGPGSADGGDVHGLSLARRFEMWGRGLETVREHPWFGSGAGSRALADNFFMKTLVELGVAGLGLLVWFLAAALLSLRRAASRIPESAGLYAAGVAILLVMNLAGDFLLLHRVMGPFWLLAGMVLRHADDAGRAAA